MQTAKKKSICHAEKSSIYEAQPFPRITLTSPNTLHSREAIDSLTTHYLFTLTKQLLSIF